MFGSTFCTYIVLGGGVWGNRQWPRSVSEYVGPDRVFSLFAIIQKCCYASISTKVDPTIMSLINVQSNLDISKLVGLLF